MYRAIIIAALAAASFVPAAAIAAHNRPRHVAAGYVFEAANGGSWAERVASWDALQAVDSGEILPPVVTLPETRIVGERPRRETAASWHCGAWRAVDAGQPAHLVRTCE